MFANPNKIQDICFLFDSTESAFEFDKYMIQKCSVRSDSKLLARGNTILPPQGVVQYRARASVALLPRDSPTSRSSRRCNPRAPSTTAAFAASRRWGPSTPLSLPSPPHPPAPPAPNFFLPNPSLQYSDRGESARCVCFSVYSKPFHVFPSCGSMWRVVTDFASPNFVFWELCFGFTGWQAGDL